MVTMQEILPSKFIDLAQELMREHQKESGEEFTDIPSPQIEMYKSLEKMGWVIALGVFDDDIMIGYAIAILSQHLHYSFLYAHHDVLFLKKKYRGRVGLKLISEIEKKAAERGACYIFWHAKPDSIMGKILLKTGCKIEEIVYRKGLKCLH